MTTSMRQPTIDKKPPWWRRLSALESGLGLCAIILCTALAVGIVVIVFNSRSCDTSDDTPGMQPSKAEALMWAHLLLKRNKKMEKVVTTAVTRRDESEPESKRLQTTKPKEVVSTTAATRRDGFEPESKPPRTAKPKEVLSTTTATRRDGFEPESQPPQTIKPKEFVSTTTPTRLEAIKMAPEPNNNNDVFFTVESSMIMGNMDRSVDPCEDFYGYACGGFLKSIKIPGDRTSVDTFTGLRDQLQGQLRNIINSDNGPEESEAFKNAKTLYSSCMEHKSSTGRGLTYLLLYFETVFRGWPVLAGVPWNESFFNLEDTMCSIIRLGYSGNYIIKFEVDVDKRNSTKRVVYLDEPDLGLSRVFLVNDSDGLKNAYYSYMVDIAVLLGAEEDFASKELKSALEFEQKLAKILSPVHERFDERQLYIPMTTRELAEKYPNLSWVSECCSELLDIGKRGDEVVLVESGGYLSRLEKLMSQSSQKDLANYLSWRMVMDSPYHMSDPMRQRSLAYETRLTGRTHYPLRWKECLDFVSNSVPLTLGAMYLKKYSASQSDKVNNATGIVTDIKKGITEILEKLDWVDEKTRQGAQKKATAIRDIIIGPDELLDVAIAKEFRGQPRPDRAAYLENIVDIKHRNAKYRWQKLLEPVNKFYWAYEKAISTQVHYSKNDNSIFVPAAILQSPFFSANQPRYVYYGTIGFLIGQQLAHGFDYNGIHYDENGNLVQQMDPTTEERYLKRGQCFDEKYSNYTVTEVSLKLNGRATLSENIADTNGLKAAYTAYNNWISKNGEEQGLPGIDKTPRQLFWISAASMLCSKYRRNALEYKIHTDTRSPAEFRVNGAMSNLAEFAEDFKCSRDSTMNPTKKCSVF